jgi:hypothetical protein
VKRTTHSFWRGIRPLLFGVIAVGFVAAYCLAPDPGGSTGFLHPGSEGTEMNRKTGDGTAPRSTAIPPIDASLPGVTETATFALG